MRILVAGLLTPLVFALPAAAQDVLPLPRLEAPIRLDGIPDEPAWSSIEPLRMVSFQPVAGLPPSEPTDIRVAYDGGYLYVGAVMLDSEGVRYHSLTRDIDNGGDFLNILIDSFNDNENGFYFGTTPGGNRLDGTVVNDGEGDSFSLAWNGHWDTAVDVRPDGWSAEVRIPLTTLRFQERSGRVVMGLSINRLISRKNERVIFPEIEPSTGGEFVRPSRARDIELVGVTSHRPWYATPYLLLGERRSVLPLETGGLEDDDEWRKELGGDFKVGLTDNITLDLTVNTDFAEVESDDERVNLTRFPLFFPEKRQFFLERAGIFDFQLGGDDRLFHSRRVGLTDDGEPVRILAGGRMVGRIGEWDLGLLDVQTDDVLGRDALERETENLGVLRLRRRVVNANSYVGAMVTTRSGVEETENLAIGVDGTVNLTGEDYLLFSIADTRHSGDEVEDGFLPNGSTRLVYERRRTDGLGFEGGVETIGPDFEPGQGFVLRRDLVRTGGGATYGFLGQEGSALRLHRPFVETELIWGNSGGSLETSRHEAGWILEWASGGVLELEAARQFEDLAEPFSLAEDVVIPAGEHTFEEVSADFTPGQNWTFGVGGFVRAGTFFDGTLTSFGVGPVWNVSPHLSLRADYLHDRADFDDRDERFRAHIVRLRSSISIDARASVNAFVQLNSVADLVAGNVRFRYNLSEGHDLWVVWNHQLNTDRDRFEPRLPLSGDRSVVAKYTYTFRN
ncbi:MAG TPA: DUF5916 domain-containing protein [Gemmatimonadota bacterium]|nr:DUF5916 domain-containing protein [Gemmatimonadota bacterium]